MQPRAWNSVVSFRTITVLDRYPVFEARILSVGKYYHSHGFELMVSRHTFLIRPSLSFLTNEQVGPRVSTGRPT